MERRLLIVEDDCLIAEAAADYFTSKGWLVKTEESGIRALRRLERESFHLILLDVMLPFMDGFSLCKKIRQNSDVPVIFITARAMEEDKLNGYSLGADDYVTKPFSVTEVLARIKANIRRSTQYAAGAAESESVACSITRGELTIDTNDYSVLKRGRKIELTAKEFEILKLLMTNPRKVYTKEQIYSSVWKDAYFGDENAVNVHISRLRNKIEDNPREPKYVTTVWGIGYKLGEV